LSDRALLAKIAEIREGMRNLTVVGRISQIREAQPVKTRFGPARVAAAILEDETGSIRLNLWRDQIERVQVGDTVRIENAFIRVFKDQNELNVGKDGRITVLSRA
jgi:replication factor A1